MFVTSGEFRTKYANKQSLEIFGIPAGAYASSEAAVLKIASALDVTMSAEDVNIPHRVKSNETCTGRLFKRSLDNVYESHRLTHV